MKTIDCENCPLSWEDRGYEGDCDCGCAIYDDLYGYKPICYFPNFVKRIIWKIKNKREQKLLAHQYEGIGEWYGEQQRKDISFRQAIEECIFNNQYGEKIVLCREDKDGKRWKAEISDEYGLARMRYEELLEESEGKDSE